MKTKGFKLTLISVFWFFTYQSFAVEAPSEAAVCASCHGLEGLGNADLGYPQIAGLNAIYIKEQLDAYKNQTRINPIMQPMAAMLDDSQVLSVADYFSKMKAINRNTKLADENVMSLGKKLVSEGDTSKYVFSCVTCHGPTLNGVGSVAPRLAGQHAKYINDQLTSWKNGTRKNDANQIMYAIALRLTEEEITVVSDYISTLPIKNEIKPENDQKKQEGAK